MNNPYTRDDIGRLVQRILESVVGAGPIDETAAIVNDLGADSLDFVELNTTVEKRLGIVLPKSSALDHAKRISGEPRRFYDPRTGLTSDGVLLLERCFYRYKGLTPGSTALSVFNATTLGNVVDLCHALFNYLPERCPDCGHGAATISPAGRAVCEACRAPVKPLHGDEAHARHLSSVLGSTVS